MKALVGAVNQEKALVGAFSVIVQPVVKPMEHYTALVITRTRGHVPHNLGGEEVLPAAGEDVRGGVQAVAPHRGLHGPELVSPCASVRGLGVRGVGAVTTLSWLGWAGPTSLPRDGVDVTLTSLIVTPEENCSSQNAKCHSQ